MLFFILFYFFLKNCNGSKPLCQQNFQQEVIIDWNILRLIRTSSVKSSESVDAYISVGKVISDVQTPATTSQEESAGGGSEQKMHVRVIFTDQKHYYCAKLQLIYAV